MESIDVVIIGSGYGGSIAALRLAEAGRRVVVLEKGRRLKATGLRQTQDPKYILSLIKLYQGEGISLFAAEAVGGGSIPTGAAMLRPPSETFAQEDASGRRLWPRSLDRTRLEPYFARAEAVQQVRQVSWEEVPKKGGAFARMLDRVGLTCDRGRYAIVDCLNCGWCRCGCLFGRKQSLTANYIPMAEAEGAEFRPLCEARTISASGSDYVVNYLDRTKASREITAPLVIIACGTVQSPALLLRSQLAGGLSDLSPMVGKNLHANGNLGILGLVPDQDPDPEMYKGRENAGVITYAFWKEHRFNFLINTPLPLEIVVAYRISRQDSPPPRTWGLEHKRFMRLLPKRVISLESMGLAPADGEITLSGPGEPMLRCEPSPEYLDYVDLVHSKAREIFEGSGGELLHTSAAEDAVVGGAHQLSTCRMGDDAATGVVDMYGEVFGCPNLYICDGSAVPSPLGVNPALTISALAEWITERIVAGG